MLLIHAGYVTSKFYSSHLEINKLQKKNSMGLFANWSLLRATELDQNQNWYIQTTGTELSYHTIITGFEINTKE